MTGQVFEATLGCRRHHSHLLINNLGWDAAACLSWASLLLSLTLVWRVVGEELLGGKAGHLYQMDIRETGLNRLLIPLQLQARLQPGLESTEGERRCRSWPASWT